jgi:uncharacterized pyridoxamine 5'-phosphate oxidase family protein
VETRKKIIERIPLEEKENLLQNYLPFLSKGKFVNVATCNLQHMPNVAPKLIAKVEKNIIYLIDYIVGSTYSNLSENPRVSISFIDEKSLTGYQLNGTVNLLEKGKEHDALAEEFQQIKTQLTVERILFNVRTGAKTPPPELALPEEFVIIQVKIFEIVEISSSGGLKSKFAI